MIIAIDGTAASGKSTTARRVARDLGYRYVDTGAMYRAVALKFMRQSLPLDDQEAVVRVLQETDISQVIANSGARTFLDGEDVTDPIRSPEVTAYVGPVCEIPQVREKLVDLQRQWGKDGGVVVEGRDIGTVVFPDADMKIFMDASLKVRTRRRRQEWERKGLKEDSQAIATGIDRRDRRDSERKQSPLKAAPGAIHVDTSGLTIEEQVNFVLEKVREAKAAQKG